MHEFLQQLVNGLMVGGVYAIVAIGFALVLSAMRVINMAHPNLLTVGAYCAAVLAARVLPVEAASQSFLIGSLALLACVGLAGAVTGGMGIMLERLVIRPLRGRNILIPFVATSGIGIAIVNVLQAIFGPDPIPIPRVMPYVVLTPARIYVTSLQLTTFVVAMVLMITLTLYIRRSRWGRATRAVADRFEVAAACGVNVNAVYRLTLGIASAMGGIAGVLIGLLNSDASPYMGTFFGIKAFVCVLVAGNRHLEGVMAVGLILGVLEALVSGYISSSFRDAIAFGVLIFALALRPRGLFGSYES